MTSLPSVKLASFVLLVQDVSVSKKFYADLFSQEIALDLGVNVGFKSGLALWQKAYAENVIFGPDVPARPGTGCEIYFETEDPEAVLDEIRKAGVELVHGIREQPWGQRVFRAYDPDRFIVEVAEPMDAVVKRMHRDGISDDGIAEKTTMPVGIVRQILQ